MTTDEELDEEFYREVPGHRFVDQALDEHREGKQITARCLKCGQLLSVDEVPGALSIWVQCPKRCTDTKIQFERWPSWAHRR